MKKREISIHAPLTGSDTLLYQCQFALLISIHAPLTGSDGSVKSLFHPGSDFNPRSPYGERQSLWIPESVRAHFNPRSPYGERQEHRWSAELIYCISIHAPLTGSDRQLAQLPV